MVVSLYRYFQSVRRLRSAKQTIQMMGGNEDDIDGVTLGNRDMRELECEYHLQMAKAEVLYILIGIGVGYGACYYHILEKLNEYIH